ncbi:MAG: leucine-rich repeat protein, partial [Clostridia bacterium]|nr:leucine-rich repeat protein [Clostridia bacterium]
MKHLSKVLAIVLSVCLLLAFVPAVLADDDPIASGTFDDFDTPEIDYNTTWAVMPDGRLIIGGTGPMPDFIRLWDDYSQTYYYYSDPPYYAYKDQITSLVFDGSITHIGNYAFFNWSDLNCELILPNTLETIGVYSFSDCSGLHGSLVIPDATKKIGFGAFSNCSGFDGTLTIGNSVETIEDNAFEFCSSFVGDLIFPDSVRVIGGCCFSCVGFHGRLIFGSCLETIGFASFQQGHYTGDLIIPDSVTTIESCAFDLCDGFTGDLVISNSLRTIKHWTFRGCTFRGTLTIGNSVETIEERAFEDCSEFTGKLSIPASVTSIGTCAFHGCAANADIALFFEDYPQYIRIDNLVYSEEPATPSEQGYISYRVYCTSCNEEIGIATYTIDYISITGIFPNQTDYTLYPQGTQQIISTVNPLDATNQTLAFSSNDTSVATVDENGLITAVAPGTSTITITPADGGSEAYATVTVTVTCPHSSLNAAVKENEVPATATQGGSYDLVVYCSDCGDEVVRINVTTDPTGSSGTHTHTAGDATIENENPASCTSGGSYDVVFYCTDCGDQIARTTIYTAKTQHNPNPAVIENEVPATETESGSYDVVVYCADCGNAVSRTTFYTDPTGVIITHAHTPGDAVVENNNPATCTSGGSYELAYYCTDCGNEIKRTTVYTEPTQHNLNQAVKENEVPASVTAGGSYDLVIYCADCGNEVSRTTVYTDPISTEGHVP